MDHVRIDEGIKRGKRLKPSELEKQARDEAGQFLTRYTPELKKLAVAEALIALEVGARVEDVAAKHSIPVSTMYSWLVGTEAGRVRTQFFDGQTTRNLCEIRASQTPLELARADRELNGWLKVAAVRDPSAYGPKQELTVTTSPQFHVHVNAMQPIDTQVIDALPILPGVDGGDASNP